MKTRKLDNGGKLPSFLVGWPVWIGARSKETLCVRSVAANDIMNVFVVSLRITCRIKGVKDRW